MEHSRSRVRVDPILREEPLTENRRLAERKGVKVNRLVRATLDLGNGERREDYLYVMDISEGGMRVNVDKPFADAQPLRLHFTLQYLDLDLEVKPIWQEELPGGTWVSGLMFHAPSAIEERQIRATMAAFSDRGHRDRFRLKSLVSVSIRKVGSIRWLGVLPLLIAPNSLRIRCNELLDIDTEVDTKILLPDLREVGGRAAVVWQRQARPGRFEYGLRFNAISYESAAAIHEHLDRCIGAT